MKITNKARVLVEAWDSSDAGHPLTDDQKYALEEWVFIQATQGTTKAEQDLDRQVLRTAVRIARGNEIE